MIYIPLGEGARLAARSAVQGCLEYLDTAIFGQVPGLLIIAVKIYNTFPFFLQ